MRLIHLSDLHWGTECPHIVESLRQCLSNLNPDLIVISGDFTQIASTSEFKMAQEFAASLAAPVFTVPGNHDIPRFNILERLLNPYKKYKSYINEDLAPVLRRENIVIAGINTARHILPHWNWANGAISSMQIAALRRAFEGDGDACRVCVFHHPAHKALETPLKVKVFGARKAMKAIADMKIDLVLTGHVHHASITVSGQTVFASASTAISLRLRAQENGFNVIDFDKDSFEITHWTYNGTTFTAGTPSRHNKNR
jgi:predicted MPP superfamily phosphohydrolase